MCSLLAFIWFFSSVVFCSFPVFFYIDVFAVLLSSGFVLVSFSVHRSKSFDEQTPFPTLSSLSSVSFLFFPLICLISYRYVFCCFILGGGTRFEGADRPFAGEVRGRCLPQRSVSGGVSTGKARGPG